MSSIADIILRVKACSDPDRIAKNERFLQCFPGGYGEGDHCLGVRVPELRKIAKQYENLNLSNCAELLQNDYHEIRLLALFILVMKYKRKDTLKKEKDDIVEVYLENTSFINNWDLVDSSALYILGMWCFEKRDINYLLKLAKSSDLWENRIAIIATFYHIRQNSYSETLQIADMLLEHKHDLIHKAVGWMLREVGNRNKDLCQEYLERHYQNMPRTMLRYAIEKFDEPIRKEYLLGKR